MSFTLALDEPDKNDIVEKIEELQFVIAPAIHNNFKSFTIKSHGTGPAARFSVTAANQPDIYGCCDN